MTDFESDFRRGLQEADIRSTVLLLARISTYSGNSNFMWQLSKKVLLVHRQTPVTAMPCTVTAFSVKIASPGDAGIELTIVRGVIAEWNAHHALAQKRILLPLDEEEAGNHAPADMLIAFFCGPAGSSSERIADGSETEIEQHLQEGKPTLIYLSEARVNLAETQGLRLRALDELKKRYATAVVDSYADEKDLRAKFARQLESTVSGHSHFKTGASLSVERSPECPKPAAAPAAKPLSLCAQAILTEACDDFEAYIGRIKVGGTLRIQANGKQLVEQDDPDAAVRWESAFQELLTGGFIRDAGCNGQLFQISTRGFEFLKTIGKTPVGYIAELGGM